jgi:hypothetical protein
MEVVMGFQREGWADQERRPNKVVLISQVHFSIVLDAKTTKRIWRSQFIERAFMREIDPGSNLSPLSSKMLTIVITNAYPDTPLIRLALNIESFMDGMSDCSNRLKSAMIADSDQKTPCASETSTNQYCSHISDSSESVP